jgi:hypothetical protein
VTNDLVSEPERLPAGVLSLPVARRGPASPDGSWHDTLVVISALASMHKQVATYVLRVLDADAGREEPPSPAAGQALGARLVELGCVLQANTRSRDAGDVGVGAPTSDRGREPQVAWAADDSYPIYVADSE